MQSPAREASIYDMLLYTEELLAQSRRAWLAR